MIPFKGKAKDKHRLTFSNIEIAQLVTYVHAWADTGKYWGDSEEWWARHNNLVKILSEAIDIPYPIVVPIPNDYEKKKSN